MSLAMRNWLNAVRARQWSKNLLLFVPLILSRTFVDPAAVVRVAGAFLIFNAVVSASYLFNDVLDIESDRRHPSKQKRALAAGALSVRAALSVAAVLLIGGLAASLALGLLFTAILVFYVIVAAAYSLVIKRMPLSDVLTIGVLFSARVGAGAVAIPVFVSPWLISFSFLLFLSLALAKRHVEVIRASRLPEYTLKGRGYRADDWPLTLSIGVAAALSSLVIMLIYTEEAATTIGGFHHPIFLYPITAVILLWVMRIWLLSHRGELDDDPVDFAFKDKFSLALAAACIALLTLAI
jgi:4-hydroxybenzoate polyprenyltransferase